MPTFDCREVARFPSFRMSILVVENPSPYGESAPYDSFVLITIDIASSLRGVTDKVAIQAAEALPRATCLAWIGWPG